MAAAVVHVCVVWWLLSLLWWRVFTGRRVSGCGTLARFLWLVLVSTAAVCVVVRVWWCGVLVLVVGMLEGTLLGPEGLVASLWCEGFLLRLDCF